MTLNHEMENIGSEIDRLFFGKHRANGLAHDDKEIKGSCDDGP